MDVNVKLSHSCHILIPKTTAPQHRFMCSVFCENEATKFLFCQLFKRLKTPFTRCQSGRELFLTFVRRRWLTEFNFCGSRLFPRLLSFILSIMPSHFEIHFLLYLSKIVILILRHSFIFFLSSFS